MTFIDYIVEFLALEKITPEMIEWVGDFQGHKRMAWEDFKKIGNFEYDPTDLTLLPADLIVKGEWWYLSMKDKKHLEFEELPGKLLKRHSLKFHFIKCTDKKRLIPQTKMVTVTEYRIKPH